MASRLRKVTTTHRGGGGRSREDSYGPLSGLLSLSMRARSVLCVRETCRVQTCGRVSVRVRACPCLRRVWCRSSRSCLLSCQRASFFLLACGALRRVASAEGHRLPALRARRPPVHSTQALPPPGVHMQRRSRTHWHHPPRIP